MALTLTFDASKNQIKTKLGWTNESLRDTTEIYMIKKAKELEDYMKANHRWKNRTGNAERTMSASVTSSRMSYVQTIELSYGVFYGVYLEYAMERRFAIIEPTMRIKGPEIVNDLRGLLGIFIKTKGV